jgi:hypothetical protein
LYSGEEEEDRELDGREGLRLTKLLRIVFMDLIGRQNEWHYLDHSKL